MQFVDEVEVEVRAGAGGNGCIAFRREKFVPLGGPSGGDGGKGGDIVFEASTRMSTLLDLRYKRILRAKRGEHGRGKDQYGKGGEDIVIAVPVWTQVYDAESGELVADLQDEGQREIVAAGGRGGRGNIHFATPQNRAPRKAEEGRPGEERLLRLELKLIADVGVVGYPNVSKSTFISAVSRAKPKIADYPFTTLTPNLGVASPSGDVGDERSFVIADIPGIIEGAAEGAGLGHRFLRHVERNRVLLHVITLDPDPERDPIQDFDTLMDELRRFSPELATRPMIVAVSKTDLTDVREMLPVIEEEMKKRGHEVLPFSSAAREGLQDILIALERTLAEAPRHDAITPKDKVVTSEPTAFDEEEYEDFFG